MEVFWLVALTCRVIPEEFRECYVYVHVHVLLIWRVVYTQVLELMQMHPKERLRRVILTGIWFNAMNVGYYLQHGQHRSCTIEWYERERRGFPYSGTFFPWEFPESLLAYSHISLKGPNRSIIYGKIFWPPRSSHPNPQIASPASIYHQN